jgi:hypothetical protein
VRPIADKVVGQVAGMPAREVVWLIAWDEHLLLLEDLAVEVQRRRR